MRQFLFAAASFAAFAPLASLSAPPLLPSSQVAAIANELSGEAAKRNLEGLARFHRQRGSEGFHAAAELVAERARAYGLSDVEILRFAADGKIRYGTQRSRPAWDVDEAELSEIQNGKVTRVASYAASPIVLAEDSESADVTAPLVDVGEGSHESDYVGKDVRGRIVLAAEQPGAVAELAVGKFGAAGSELPATARATAATSKHGDATRYHRRDEPRGPLVVFGYDYFAERTRAAGISKPKLLEFQGAWGAGEEYAYEALNFADGRHTVQQVAEELSAEYGPVAVDLVLEYLEALKRIGVVE